MTPFYLFGSTFILVFTLGLQSQLVNRGHTIAAFINSLCIGTANLMLFVNSTTRCSRHEDR